jgi:hypothetical protein
MSLKNRVWRFFEVTIDLTISNNRSIISHYQYFFAKRGRRDYVKEIPPEMVETKLMRSGEIL